MSKSLAKLNYDNAQIALIKRTYAKDCSNDEFDLFMQTCAYRGLDPFRREIYAQVFNKNKPDLRQLVIVVGIDGLRSIAEKSGNYRPDDEDPNYTYNESLKSDLNPCGIEKVSVKVWKQDNQGGWNKINGTAYWEEFAPLKEMWEVTDNSKGKKVPSGKFNLSEMWRKMPRLMIAKCAEAQALRKGWSSSVSGLYAEEEIEREILKDVTPSQAVEEFNKERRLRATQGLGTVLFQWKPGEELSPEPVGKLGDKLIDHVRKIDRVEKLNSFEGINQHALRQFWAMDKSAALEVKREMENKREQLEKDENPQP